MQQHNQQQDKSDQPCVVLPGTFKSMLHPNTTGDINITISGVSSLNELLITRPQSPPPTPPSKNEDSGTSKNVVIESKVVDARVQLAYRQYTNHESPRRAVINCKGKFSITNKPAPNGVENSIKQYDMLFAQSDIEPGKSFFSVTFSKTLVQNTQIPDDHISTEKGIMLSGHYTCLRNYDLGTVRVHLSSSLMTGELAPNLASSSMSGSDHTPSPTLNRRKSGTFQPTLAVYLDDEAARQFDMSHERASRPFSHSVSSVSSAGSIEQHHYQHPQSHGHPTPPRGVRYCYGCGDSGHLHKDCPRDQLFCYNCNQTGHSSKNCKKPKPWEQANLMQSERYDAMQSPSKYARPMYPTSSDPWNMSAMADTLPGYPKGVANWGNMNAASPAASPARHLFSPQSSRGVGAPGFSSNPNYFQYPEVGATPSGLFSPMHASGYSPSYQDASSPVMNMNTPPQKADASPARAKHILSDIEELEAENVDGGELRLEDLMPAHQQSMRSFWESTN